MSGLEPALVWGLVVAGACFVALGVGCLAAVLNVSGNEPEAERERGIHA